MDGQRDWVALVGRALFAATFIVTGWQKIVGFSASVGYIASAGLPFPSLLNVASIVVEFGGGLAVLLGWKTRWAALGFIVFVLVVTPVFHAFWSVPPAQAMMQQVNFLKNVAILGGAVLLLAFGPGRYSVDGA